MTAPYPLIFDPILLEKVWGGRRLERYGKKLPPGRPIGESWEVADLPQTSASGAGGGAMRSIIASGALRGHPLADAAAVWGDQLDPAARDGFPLLVKYLDARENLSVQVHPSAGYASSHPDVHVKFEAWYVVEAQPGAVIYAGLREGVGADELRTHVEHGTVESVLNAVPAVPGRCHVLPSGACHALGAGVLVAEVQTPSDTTFRLWDWGRSGRTMHVEEALACVEAGPCPPTECRADVLASTAFFSIARGRNGTVSGGGDGGCAIIMMVRGSASLTWRDGSMILRGGDTALVPAALTDFTSIQAPDGAEWLVVRPRQSEPERA